MEDRERQIILDCQRGNLSSFGLLYDDYIKKIYDFIFYRVRQKETAEDLTSQTFFKALKNINQFNVGRGSFSAWLYRIARNSVIDHYRTSRPQTDLDGLAELGESGKIEEKIDLQERIEKVEEFLKDLTEEQREIVLMRLWDQLSYKEIADITKKSEASCRMVFSRTIAKIRMDLTALAITISILIVSS